jgi:hypothetical protein
MPKTLNALNGILGALAKSSCARSYSVECGLYSVEAEGGVYTIVKILKVDPDGVHLRLYSNHFASRPPDVDTTTLYMAGMNRAPGELLGMGHAPISRASFATWGAEIIKVVPVEPSELEGYEMWKDAEGGYF